MSDEFFPWDRPERRTRLEVGDGEFHLTKGSKDNATNHEPQMRAAVYARRAAAEHVGHICAVSNREWASQETYLAI